MPPKRKSTDRTLELMGSFFDQLFAAASQMDSNLPEGTTTSSYLRKLKSQVLSKTAEKEREATMAAKEFTLSDAVDAFRLIYSPSMTMKSEHFWNIDDMPETKNFVPTPCIGKASL